MPVYVLCVAEIYSEQNKTLTLLKVSQFPGSSAIWKLTRIGNGKSSWQPRTPLRVTGPLPCATAQRDYALLHGPNRSASDTISTDASAEGYEDLDGAAGTFPFTLVYG
jgi:hypothetical protein